MTRFQIRFSSSMAWENFWKERLPMLYALISRIPEMYSIITELKPTRERLTSDKTPFILRKMTAITMPARGSGSGRPGPEGH